MKKMIVLLAVLTLSCQKKVGDSALQSEKTSVQITNSSVALDSVTIAKLVAINPAEQWNNAKAYKAGEVIRYHDETWIAIRPGYQNTPPPDPWFWQKVSGTSVTVQKSVGKIDSVVPVSNGSVEPYNPDHEYKTGDKVQFEGKTFVAKRAVFLNTNPNDSWFWEVVK